MYKPLKKRKVNPESHWLEVWENIDKIISRDHIKRLTFDTVDELITSTAGKKVAYGWSGGKDALVLEKICDMSGIQDRLLIKTDLEYHDFLDFLNERIDDRTTVVTTRHDIEWLSKNPENLFPFDRKYVGDYMVELRRQMEKHFFNNNLDQFIIGLRIADGNNVPSRIIENKNGYTKNSPIKDWTHEELLAFIYYHDIELPKIYSYERTFNNSTGPYYKMIRKKGEPIENKWDYLYRHDKLRMKEAARYFESAYEYLGGINK